MSNLLTGPDVEVERRLFAELLVEPERTKRVARLLGAEAIVQLSEHITFNDIFRGEVPISEETIVFDRHGKQLDAAQLVSQVEVA